MDDDMIGALHDAEEGCNCNSCAVEFRDRHKRELASISEELGLPPGMGPAKGVLRKLLGNGRKAIDRLSSAPQAVSAEVDFYAMTWTFKIKPGCQARAGTYALVWMGQSNPSNKD